LTFLLHAFRHIVRALPAARLVLVGGGDPRLPLERLTNDPGLRASVPLVGAVAHERIGDYTRAADLLLSSSTSETQGLAALEPLAAGVPVVAVASVAAMDLLKEESAGIICSEDPEAFATGVTVLWATPETRFSMAAAARSIAAGFAPAAGAAKLLALYGKAVRATRRVPATLDTLHSGEART
jgi:glycosyltransferase involved in cell wall biosynthesis